MSDKWEVRSESWINPVELLFGGFLGPSRRYWVKNRESGKWKVLIVHDDQEVGEAIANGQFEYESSDDSPAYDDEVEERNTGENDDSQDEPGWFSETLTEEHADERDSYLDSFAVEPSPYVPPAPPAESPAEIAQRLFAAAATATELRELRSRFSTQVAAGILEKLYLSYLERLEAAIIDAQLREIAGRTSEQLHRQFRDEVVDCVRKGTRDKDWSEPPIAQLELLARLVEETEAASPGELALRADLLDAYPARAILARRKLRALREERASSDFVKLGRIAEVGFYELQSYFFHHQFTDFAIVAMRQVTNKVFLLCFCRDSVPGALDDAARESYFTILKKEQKRRSLWKKCIYNVLFRKFEHDLLNVCPDWVLPE